MTKLRMTFSIIMQLFFSDSCEQIYIVNMHDIKWTAINSYIAEGDDIPPAKTATYRENALMKPLFIRAVRAERSAASPDFSIRFYFRVILFLAPCLLRRFGRKLGMEQTIVHKYFLNDFRFIDPWHT